jgi:hypothetical protein
MSVLTNVFNKLLLTKQSSEKSSQTESQLLWSEIQTRLTIGNFGAGAAANETRYQLNRCLAAGAFSASKMLKTVVLEQSIAPGIVYDSKDAIRLEPGQVSRPSGLKDGIDRFIGVIRPVPGIEKISFLTRQAYGQGLRFQSPTYVKYAVTYETGPPKDHDDDKFSYLVGRSNSNPGFSDSRLTLLSNGSYAPYFVPTWRVTLSENEYAAWRGRVTGGDASGFSADVAFDRHQKVYYHRGWGLKPDFTLDEQPQCDFAIDRRTELTDKIKLNVDLLKLHHKGDDVKFKNSLKAYKASDRYKEIVDELATCMCESSGPHYHAPIKTKAETVLPLNLSVVMWGAEPGLQIDGWEAVNPRHKLLDSDDPGYPTGHVIGFEKIRETNVVKNHEARVVHSAYDKDAEGTVLDESPDYPYAYMYTAHVADYHVREYSSKRFMEPVESSIPLGVHDLRDYVTEALAAISDSKSEASDELADLKATLTSKFGVLSLNAISQEEKAKSKLEHLLTLEKKLITVGEHLGQMIHAADVTKQFRLPVSQGGKPGLTVKVYLPEDGSLDVLFREELEKLRKASTLRTIIALAPEEAIHPKEGLRPLPEDVHSRLVAMRDASRGPKVKGKNPAMPSDIAWKDLIIGFNASNKYHGFKPIKLDHRLQPYRPAMTGKQSTPLPASAPSKIEQENRILLDTLVKSMVTLSSTVKDLKESNVGASTSKVAAPVTADVVSRLEEIMEEADEAVKPLAPPRTPSRAGSEDPSLGGWAPSSRHSSDSHITVNGAKWSRFDPFSEQIKEGGAYLLVRSVHDHNLYICPRTAEIPSSRELSSAVPLKFKSPGPPPPPPTAPKPVKKGSVATIIPVAKRVDDSDVESVSSSSSLVSPAIKAARKKAKESTSTQSVIVAIKCSTCPAMHGSKHDASCPHKSSTWGKLNAEMRKARKALLTGEAVAETKETVKSGKTPRIEKDDPLKTQAVKKTLSKADEGALRKYFAVPRMPSPAELESLPAEEQKEAISKAQLPKWAVAAVLAHHDNLGAIKAGDLTKDKFNAGIFKREAKTTSQIDVTKKWLAIKNKFDGISLLEKPRSPKEVAFRKEYDALKKEVGDHPALPKPKKSARDQGGRSPRPSTPQGGSSSGSVSLDALKSLAEIMKALR